MQKTPISVARFENQHARNALATFGFMVTLLLAPQLVEARVDIVDPGRDMSYHCGDGARYTVEKFYNDASFVFIGMPRKIDQKNTNLSDLGTRSELSESVLVTSANKSAAHEAALFTPVLVDFIILDLFKGDIRSFPRIEFAHQRAGDIFARLATQYLIFADSNGFTSGCQGSYGEFGKTDDDKKIEQQLIKLRQRNSTKAGTNQPK